MRTKFFILLALFVAFSSMSFAQTAVQEVVLELTENRTLSLPVLPLDALEVKRGDTAGPLSTVLTVTHDLGIDQKVMVEAAITDGDWAGRYLDVSATLNTLGGTAAETAGAGVPLTLISDGIVIPAQEMISTIDAQTGTVDLDYNASADLDATAGTHKADITYTIMDQ